MTKLQRLLFLAATAAAFAGPALADTPELPPCKAGGGPVTLVIRTDTSSGWTVNGAPVSAVSNPGWTSPGSATWIGPAGGTGPATLVYKVSFDAPFMHGLMSVSARWAADNCGTSLKAGNGGTVSTGPCYMASSPNGRDFLSFTHITNATFAPGDSSNPQPSITFTVANQNGTATGFAGEFTITALCVCR